ncbi:hypothetical protein HBI24_216380 [Parastagonospora nodorum]|nr:hypothetical protein HBH75_196220 [Parastagonospora nodorum]KAH4915415.1 hypothetical protein HBI79_234440 [Parastagonospora nodorum]KAH5142380.1 hypothetical protein HBH69_201450 [Parastagonospora nodorum]KAH5241270.1 hypothetical protein HBI71_209150 [Parastagonospora nodorum]KAH5291321.1 hypothetical protein HBI12_241480 [Parastagonospora nodorum]
MANDNDDNSRRTRERPEDNPFIAFRRFADSQVASLMNTVFTLPATIANYNNVHQAREACLFKKADQAQCDKLQEIEGQIAGLRNEGRELYRVGDLQQVLRKSEELMKLDRHADELRKEIVGKSDEGEDSTELVHRVANKKGQEWGWDWSWGFPKPFDDDRDVSNSTSPSGRGQALDYLHQFERESKRIFGEDAYDEAMDAAWTAMQSSPILRGLVSDKELELMQGLIYRSRPYAPQALESDSQMQHAGVNWREAYEDLVRTQEEENRARTRELRSKAMKDDRYRSYPKQVPWTDEEHDDEPSYEYSHDHEDQHDDPPTPKMKHGDSFTEWCKYAPEQSASDKRVIAKFLSVEQRENDRWLGTRESESTNDWCDPAQEQNASDKRDIQKFLAHQQQNGRELALRESLETTETELDAYEQLLEKPKGFDYVKAAPSSDSKPSILSTLTTTERTVAPDGSVTTKVVLKKRFADGREESSETVHTQRGQEPEPWATRQTPEVRNYNNNDEVQGKEKKSSGWFWSS